MLTSLAILAASYIQAWFLWMHAMSRQATYSISSLGPPPGFPESGNGLWYSQPGSAWAKDFLPIGNGHMGAMILGGTGCEIVQLNIESLWTGGPFADPYYNGGNHPAWRRTALAHNMQTIRQAVFRNKSGEIDSLNALATPIGQYGSYTSAASLISRFHLNSSTERETVSNYARWLDMDRGVVLTTWTQGQQTFTRTSFCSHPARACVQHQGTSIGALPTLTYAFSPPSVNANISVTCLTNTTLQLRGRAGGNGMLYEILGRVYAPGSELSCEPVPSINGNGNRNATIRVEGASESWITWVGGTTYDLHAKDFEVKAADLHLELLTLLSRAAGNTTERDERIHYEEMLAAHVHDVTALLAPFSLSFDIASSDVKNLPPTDVVKALYRADRGNRWLEWVLFNYGRYLLGSSARGMLPANLQGVWAEKEVNPWGAESDMAIGRLPWVPPFWIHRERMGLSDPADANINLQMNYWAAEMTNLDVTHSLWSYIEKTWVPRGEETARTLYNISRGWVTHHEMNIFGHTGMKIDGNPDAPRWADYPESAVWMMMHAWDHFDYTNNVEWWRDQGWPLVKGVASFHLEKLIPDLHFNDGTLVTSPCNSPEQAPITFGCAHSQQLIWQLFNIIEKGFDASGDTDIMFLTEVRTKRAQMDKGIRIGSWGQLQEWKIDRDLMDDTHRHLSHLIGLYPGYAIASYNPIIQPVPDLLNPVRALQYTHEDIRRAAAVSLVHRGDGTGTDADAGWEKIWRAAAWAQLEDASGFYYHLSYAIERNFGPNLFSLYDPNSPDPIFQIDANLGYPAAVLNALLQAPDVASLSTPLTITILPALPPSWPNGALIGARVRGGIRVDLRWVGGQPSEATFSVDHPNTQWGKEVRIVWEGRVVSSFLTSGRMSKSITF